MTIENIKWHPIIPTPDLVTEWKGDLFGYDTAARWGADQELEACLEWMFREPVIHEIVGRDGRYLDFELRAFRRPSNSKGLALAILDSFPNHCNDRHKSIIRGALEALPSPANESDAF
jgi:hypothetical protein